jgi:hypothetical protein
MKGMADFLKTTADFNPVTSFGLQACMWLRTAVQNGKVMGRFLSLNLNTDDQLELRVSVH